MNEVNAEKSNYNFIDDEVSLNEILKPVLARRWKIIFFTLCCTAAASFYVSLLKPSYQATAVLQIGSNKPSNTLSINDAFNESNASMAQVQTQYELLRSRKFAERVIIHLNLQSHPEFTSGKYNDKYPWIAEKKELTTLSLARTIAAFQSRLKISQVAKTELVEITFTAYNPELAKQIANQVGETYLQYQDEIHHASNESTTQWLVDQLAELGKKLQSSELALQKFREAEELVDIKGVVGLVGGELTQLTSSLLQATRIQDDLKVTYQYIQKHRNNFAKLLDLKDVNKHPSYVKLRSAEELIERKISELSRRYGPKHPKRIAVAAELNSVQKRMIKQVEENILSIEKDYFTVQEKVDATKDRLALAKADFLRLSRLENKFSQLQREVNTNKELYSTYLVRLKEADAMGNYKAKFYVRFIDKAVEPKNAVAPKKKLIVTLSFILSFMVFSMFVIMRELLKDTLDSRRKLDNFNEAPVIAVLPQFKVSTSKRKDDAYSTDNQFTEAIRTLRTSLLFNHNKKPPKVIAITSSVPNEGKSTVALHLARSFSEMEKVLLIEADMRHPTLAKNMNLKAHRPGLSNLLAKTHQINECIVRDKSLKLDILTSGVSPANPLAFLSMKRFNMLIKVFGNFYDRIIIETPPVNAVSDAVIISKLVESVIYVVHGGKTKREQITLGLRMLKQVGAPIEGVVINQSQNIDSTKYQNKYYNDMANIIKLPLRKQG